MAKTTQKTIMDMTPQELLKSFVQQVGSLIDARMKVLEINLRGEIRVSEERLTKKIESVEQKIDKTLQDHEDRIEIIEEHIGLPHKN